MLMTLKQMETKITWDKIISSLDFLCHLIIKEHDEFGVAFKLYFQTSQSVEFNYWGAPVM